jgi:diacylglycerol kinase (ATP)
VPRLGRAHLVPVACVGEPEPTALIVNPAARSGEEAFRTARARLAELGVPLVLAEVTQEPSELKERIRRSLALGARTVVVGGGDGSLSAAAGLLLEAGAAMAVLPLGTGNDFARSLGLPLDLEGACAVAAGGQRRQVDVGAVNGRPFLNAASVGVSTAVTERLTDELKRRLGRGAFAVAAAREALLHQPFEAELRTEEGAKTLWVHQVVVGNGRYHGGGRLVAPQATLEDRRLNVYAIGARRAELPAESPADPSAEPPAESAGSADRVRDWWTLLRVGMALRRGRHLHHPQVTHLRVRWLELSCAPEQALDVDGELAGQTPARFEVWPAALQVLAPAG